MKELSLFLALLFFISCSSEESKSSSKTDHYEKIDASTTDDDSYGDGKTFSDEDEKKDSDGDMTSGNDANSYSDDSEEDIPETSDGNKVDDSGDSISDIDSYVPDDGGEVDTDVDSAPPHSDIDNPDNKDMIAPAAISDLSITSCDENSCRLTWSATGDDGSEGTASAYEIRYSTSNISNETDFNGAVEVFGEPNPEVAGSRQTTTVTGLEAETKYYFSIKAADEVPNLSAMSNIASDTTSAVPTVCNQTYSNEDGSGLAGVGDTEDRNTYRGIYWTGPTKTVCAVEFELRIKGNISAINYDVTVWEVDVQNDLYMSKLLAKSETVSGADIVNGWNRFVFPTEVLLTTGKTVVVISRVDAGTRDGDNNIRVLNGYDQKDEESNQWNIHYSSDKRMAGRRPGDEDQPEYFTCNIRLFGRDTNVESNTEYPNMPEDIEATATAHDTIHITWHERGQGGVEVDHYNVYEYSFDSSGYTATLIGSSKTTSFDHTGLAPNSTHYYVVRAVSTDGVEGYHSLKNGDKWMATTD